MRLRNVKNKEELMNSCDRLIFEPLQYKGKWNELFGNNNPIYIEIGMGKGKFIVENALKNPNINYIGIEKFDSILARACEKIPKDIKNLYIIRMNALTIDEVFDKEIDKIYLNFSDPWPKKRHHLRRLSSRVFLEKYDKIFRKDKDIQMRTDNRDLYIYSLESFSNYGYILSNITFDLHENNEEELITTEYEDKFVGKGMPIYQVTATKKLSNNAK